KAKRCDLLLDLCDALILAIGFKRILDVEAPAAFALAETLGDCSRALRACESAITAISCEQLGPGTGTPQWAEWAERADRNAKPDSKDRPFADIAIGAMLCATGKNRSGLKLLTKAFDSARNQNDLNNSLIAAYMLLNYRTAPRHAQKNVQLAEELIGDSVLGVREYYRRTAFLLLAANSFLALGMRKKAEEVWSELRTSAKRTGQISFLLTSLGTDALLLLMDGRLEEVLNITQDIRSKGEEAGMPQSANIIAGQAGNRARLYLGRSLEDLESRLRSVVKQFNMSGAIPMFCLVLANLGKNLDEVSKFLEQEVVRRPGIGTDEDETPNFIDPPFFEAAVLSGHKQAAELLLNRFAGTGVCTSGIWYPTCIPRHLGGAAALLERYDEACKHYQEAIRICTEMKFRPELALSRLELAELLLKQFPQEKSEAIAHLDFAIAEFRDMKMQPSLERALRHKEILKA
ncbi:MAG: tetratricopeptide repeat protein, partial [Thermodesulfobacteriota bacterium]